MEKIILVSNCEVKSMNNSQIGGRVLRMVSKIGVAVFTIIVICSLHVILDPIAINLVLPILYAVYGSLFLLGVMGHYLVECNNPSTTSFETEKTDQSEKSHQKSKAKQKRAKSEVRKHDRQLVTTSVLSRLEKVVDEKEEPQTAFDSEREYNKDLSISSPAPMTDIFDQIENNPYFDFEVANVQKNVEKIEAEKNTLDAEFTQVVLSELEHFPETENQDDIWSVLDDNPYFEYETKKELENATDYQKRLTR